ncbi:dienelactone hydrolase family protein [Streptomyces sp. NPDC059083]|uniref:dienelactone hydrolase family protein n=1 Tax=unclassified Streptomyces TaxID=2593676 RepID=UPI0036862D89
MTTTTTRTTTTTTTTRTVEYQADGLTMFGHLALPAGGGPRPAVLLGPEGTGLSDVERRRADALAELGYTALAFDLHGGRYLADPEEMRARCLPLLADPERLRGIGRAALDVLRAEPRTDPDRIAAVGYGTGGAIALELGRDGVDLRAIGTVNALTTGRPGEAAHIRCPVWAGVGSEDPIMSPDQRDAFIAEMRDAGIDWRLTVYGGALHAFHHPPVDHPTVPGVGHHPRHARRAWRDVIDLLAECLPVTEDPEHDPDEPGGPGR